MPNVGGKLWFEQIIRHLEYTVQTAYVCEAGERLLQTGLALRAYYDEHGALPANLQALVPRYLPAVPTDPFDGQPLRYDSAKGIVYAVGTKLADRGGGSDLGLPLEDRYYEDLLDDPAQPTLELTFHKPPTAPAAHLAPGGPPPSAAAP